MSSRIWAAGGNGLSYLLGGGGAPVWTPAALFTGQVGGFWTAAQANVFSDNGVTPITDGGKVYRVNDLSGNGNHLIQATSAYQPTWHANGGHPYITFDGVQNNLPASFGGVAQPFTRVSAFQQLAWTSGARLIGDPSGTNFLLAQAGSSPKIYNDSSGGGFYVNTGSLAVGTNGVITEIVNGASSSLAIDLITPVTADSSTGAPGGISIGGHTNGTSCANCQWSGSFAIDGTLNATNLKAVQECMAGLQGRTL